MGSNVGAVTPEITEMARRIAASQLCKHNPTNISAQNILNGYADGSLPVQIALTAIMEVSEAAGWQPMYCAPKDGTYILAVVAENDGRHLGHQAGRIFCIRHEGITSGGYDMGWAVYPGLGGCRDDYFAGWLSVPTPPSATGSI